MAVKPFDLVHKCLQKEVLVTMKGGSAFSGTMESYDENLNLFLSDAKELKEQIRGFKHLVIKGGNVISISPVE